MRFLAITVAVVMALGGSAQAVSVRAGSERAGSASAGSVRAGVVGSAYRVPVSGAVRIAHGFSPPRTRYGPGHLGVDLATVPGEAVYAAAAGTVTFSGAVAGRSVVVLLHPDGFSTEYEPLRPVVHRGQVVAAGTVLGRVTGSHHGCASDRCLHWGARHGEVYLDPLSLLRPLGVVRLVPWEWQPGQALAPGSA